MRKRHWILLGALLTGAAAYACAAGKSNDPQTVPLLDLGRYLGRWYEIARYPNRFEKQCDRDVTATYALRDDGRILVVNACVRPDGTRDEARGRAKIDDHATHAKLKVTFFWPFFGNYWVLELGQNYEYAVVGEPGRKYLWILSRTPQMSEETYRSITLRLAARGYDAGQLIKVKQTAR
jgi:apolipoprotein D and lipocalin family protein